MLKTMQIHLVFKVKNINTKVGTIEWVYAWGLAWST